MILGRNVRYRVGEIDILAKDGETIVVVEVKTLQSARAGYNPIDRIDTAKQRKLRLLASVVAAGNPDCDVRVDAFAVYWEDGDTDREPVLTHYKNIIQS